MEPTKRDKFDELFGEFKDSYLSLAKSKRHISAYEDCRDRGREGFGQVEAAAKRNQDVTDLVLLKLLPYEDTEGNRSRGAWTHIAPCIKGDVKAKFEGAGWARAEDWPSIAQAILEFVRTCHASPRDVDSAVRRFDESGYCKGFQTGTMSPILNSLRPEEFLIVNNKSRRFTNYFAGTSYSQKLTNYVRANAAERGLVGELADRIREATTADVLDGDVLDMFSHWLVAIKKFKFTEPRYWKIAPGEEAWNWEACREGGFIAIGWDDLGDVSGLSRAEFKTRRNEEISKHSDWNKVGADQVWKFSRIHEGDRVIANRGTSEVLGIGTVVGAYEFVLGQRHGHRLPVAWDDLRVREVSEGGWRRTLVELARKKFEEISHWPADGDGPPPVADGRAFSRKAFDLLEALHRTPTQAYYAEHKDKFKTQVEEPFQQLFRWVIDRLPPEVRDAMETKKHLFGRIPKNDWGRGGAWDFYWGALYTKGGERTKDAQLFVWMNHQHLRHGFYIGKYGSDQRQRFLRNVLDNQDALGEILADSLAAGAFRCGDFELLAEGTAGPAGDIPGLNPTEWLKTPDEAGIRIAAFLARDEVLKRSQEELAGEIARTFEQLFPFVLLAALDAPLPEIGRYLDPPPPDGDGVNPPYPLSLCAEETGVEEDRLGSWIRAIKRKGQAIIYGPPGTGKTYLAERLAKHLIGGGNGFKELVQFHSAYAYEDFMQGLRPKARPDGKLDYQLVPGRFLEFCRQAKSTKDRCVLIIDEINRANLARVLGELMYLLEYRDADIPLAGGGRFRIPKNVRLIGTMNTADRSIALVDHALRRRFAFIGLYPNYDILRKYHMETSFPVEGLIRTLEAVNTEIGDRHYEIGVSFFLRDDLRAQIEDIWCMEVEPYLEEYFFDQPDKVEKFRWGAVRQAIS